VVLARPRASAQHSDVHRITGFDGVLDEVQRCVEAFQHHGLLPVTPTIVEQAGAREPDRDGAGSIIVSSSLHAHSLTDHTNETVVSLAGGLSNETPTRFHGF
jgi:hypothetical protein